jgi:hypothetical protein
VYIERTATNEEMVFLLEVYPLQSRLQPGGTVTHPAGSYVTLGVEGYHIAEKFARLINAPAVNDLPRHYGPCQATVITASCSSSYPGAPLVASSLLPRKCLGRASAVPAPAASLCASRSAPPSYSLPSSVPRTAPATTPKKEAIRSRRNTISATLTALFLVAAPTAAQCPTHWLKM